MQTKILSILLASQLLLGMEPTLSVSDIPNGAPMENTDFPFPRR